MIRHKSFIEARATSRPWLLAKGSISLLIVSFVLLALTLPAAAQPTTPETASWAIPQGDLTLKQAHTIARQNSPSQEQATARIEARRCRPQAGNLGLVAAPDRTGKFILSRWCSATRLAAGGARPRQFRPTQCRCRTELAGV